MNLILVFGASGYIGARILSQSFPQAEVIGLSRQSSGDRNLHSYQSTALSHRILEASRVIVINCIQHVPEVGPKSMEQAFEGNFYFPKRQVEWIQKILGAPPKVIQMSSYWEEDGFDRGPEKNAYVLAKKRFSSWLQTRKGDYLEAVIGDVLGPDDQRGKLLSVALENYPKPPNRFLVNPEAELQLMKIDTVLNFLVAHCSSGSLRVRVKSDWVLTVEEFVREVNEAIEADSLPPVLDESLKDYLLCLRDSSWPSKQVSFSNGDY